MSDCICEKHIAEARRLIEEKKYTMVFGTCPNCSFEWKVELAISPSTEQDGSR